MRSSLGALLLLLLTAPTDLLAQERVLSVTDLERLGLTIETDTRLRVARRIAKTGRHEAARDLWRRGGSHRQVGGGDSLHRALALMIKGPVVSLFFWALRYALNAGLFYQFN